MNILKLCNVKVTIRLKSAKQQRGRSEHVNKPIKVGQETPSTARVRRSKSSADDATSSMLNTFHTAGHINTWIIKDSKDIRNKV